jgi:predicted permease
MFSHYFLKTASRALRRKKSFSLLNILGLAIGIAASLLIFLVIRHELSFDRYQSKRDRIYRVVTTNKARSNGEVVARNGIVPLPLPITMRQEFPALEKVAALWHIDGARLYIPQQDPTQEKRFRETEGLFFAEPSLFDIFDFTWLEGNAAALNEPNTVVLNQNLAETYFGSSKNAIGKTIELWSHRIPLRVTGVFKDLPENTNVPVRLAVSYPTFLKMQGNVFTKDQWLSLNSNSQCFVLAPREHDIRRSASRLPAFVKKYYPEDEFQITSTTVLGFQPLTEVHLDTRFGSYENDRMSYKELWSLALIGLFLLLVACINFVNLATAQSVNRAKEIGVRKALGSNRYQLLKQFFSETALITFLSLILGTVLAWVAAPYLSDLLQKNYSLNIFKYPIILLYLMLTGVVVTLLAGFYPAMVLSGFSPVAAIKNKISTRTIGGISLRRGLVVFQFVIAQLLVIGTLVVMKQMKFFRNQSLGFQKEATVLINLPTDSTLKTKYQYMREQMSRVPGVDAASLCFDAPASRWGWYVDFYFENNPERQPFTVSRQFADTGYFNTFRLSLAAGRFPYPSDTVRELLVNETLVRKLRISNAADIIGKTIAFHGSPQRYPIVGVLKDYNNKPLQFEIVPIVMSSDINNCSNLALRINPKKLRATLNQVQKTFAQVYPTYMYDCTFLDERIGEFYKTEAMTAQLFKIFAALAIFICCLGLYGLVSFMAVQKTKEVGIRKVLGASVQNIVYLFSKEFTLLIGIAFLVAAPGGYYFMRGWLEDFHYHIELNWTVFGLAIALSVVIAWLTVGYKAVKAAVANPVKSLRSE